MKHKDVSRRDFLKTLGLGSLAATVPLGAGIPGKAARKPNVVLIFSDDQGTVDVNCYGTKDLHTPNMDALAKRGVRFTQFYVGAPICSPSRAALMTGRYPQRAGLATNAWGDRGLPPQQETIAEMMKKGGYRTGIFGKWHLGDVPEMSPTRQGFDEFFGHKVGCIDNYSHFFYWQGPNKHDLWRNDDVAWEDGKYFPDMVVDEAVRFMEENRDRPFFLYVPFNMPHYPLQGEPEYREMYNNADDPRSMYAAFVATLDEKIGDVVGAIDRLGLRDDTIIIFLSDHGHSVEERTFGGGGSAGPYRGHKFTLWEGGIRVPCIISWPGHIAENEVRDQAAMSLDWLPTIARYCGVEPPDRIVDGRDITAVIESPDARSPHDIMHWEIHKHWAVRDGDWKLVHNGPATVEDGVEIPSTEYFLSDLSKDVTERNNIADNHRDIVERLTRLHEDWAADVVRQ